MRSVMIVCAMVLGTATAQAATTTVKVDLADDAITFTPATVHAGKVVFNVTNGSIDENHEMVVLKLDNPDTTIPVDPRTDRIDEDAFKSMGEISKLTEGAKDKLTAILKPGSYMVLCNYKGHYRHGMHALLTVQ